MSSNILLNVLDIYLDSENPRHDPINDQPEIIDHLLQNEKVKQLARHIALHGVNPLDLVGVVKDGDGSYIAVEGNRRMCALLLLNDPEKASAGEVTYFKRLAENSSLIPSSINCVLFDNLEVANTWMSVRHDGEQDGVGIRSWNPDQKARNNSQINKKDQNALALVLIDYATKKKFLPRKRTERIITTAARYLGNPFMRETLGITSSRSDDDVKINVSCESFDKGLRRFCLDLLDNTAVHSRSRREDWIKYAQLLIEQGDAPKEKVSTHLLVECLAVNTNSSPEAEEHHSDADEEPVESDPVVDFNGESDEEDSTVEGSDDDAFEESEDNRTGSTKNPDSRKFIIPHDFKPTINNKILRRVFQEMASIEVDKQSLAVALLTRAFLENLYRLFHESVQGSYTEQPVHILLGHVINSIHSDAALTQGEKNALAALRRVQSQTMNVLSPKTLGANAHAGFYPDPKQLKREFDNISDVIKYMLARV